MSRCRWRRATRSWPCCRKHCKSRKRALDWFKTVLDQFREEIRTFANFPTYFLGLVSPTGELEHYNGFFRVVDSRGNIVADKLDVLNYADIIGEACEPDSYLKSPYYKPRGYPEGIYRVGPLARLNIADRCGTPRADQEWAEFRELDRGAVLSSFYYHYARLIEIIYGIERMEQLLQAPDILSKHVRAFAGHQQPRRHRRDGSSARHPDPPLQGG